MGLTREARYRVRCSWNDSKMTSSNQYENVAQTLWLIHYESCWVKILFSIWLYMSFWIYSAFRLDFIRSSWGWRWLNWPIRKREIITRALAIRKWLYNRVSTRPRKIFIRFMIGVPRGLSKIWKISSEPHDYPNHEKFWIFSNGMLVATLTIKFIFDTCKS